MEDIMYYGEFSNDGDICKEFGISSIDGVVIFASYEYEFYQGDADVVFIKNGNLYWVNGSHCSCHGLEDQWEPVHIELCQIRHYMEKANYNNVFSANKSIFNRLLIMIADPDNPDKLLFNDDTVIMVSKLM